MKQLAAMDEGLKDQEMAKPMNTVGHWHVLLKDEMGQLNFSTYPQSLYLVGLQWHIYIIC